MRKTRMLIGLLAATAVLLACGSLNLIFGDDEASPTAEDAMDAMEDDSQEPAPSGQIVIDENEPVFVSGNIPYTWPFFEDSNIEPFVLLEDQAGFVERDHEFIFPLEGQTIGPTEPIEEGLLGYSLTLPAVPQGTLMDVDQDGSEDEGVMIFAIAYWNNTWGDAFLEERDGTGWSTAYASTITNSDRDGEYEGGTILVWAPDGEQSFPTGFGEDAMLFTEDDPVASIPAGYSWVDMNEEPFEFYKEASLELDLVEGDFGLRDYSEMGYVEAFNTMFDLVSTEYPFTELKDIDWQAIYEEVIPLVESATNNDSYYQALRQFTYLIPDAHVGVSFNSNVFSQEAGGGLGLVLAELEDGSIVAAQVLPNSAAADAGIEPGAEIISWNGEPAAQALDAVLPYFSPYSNDSYKRLEQLTFLPRGPVGTLVEVQFQNIGSAPSTEELVMDFEIDSLFEANPFYTATLEGPPLFADILDNGMGYVRVDSFSEDPNMTARLWERAIKEFRNLDVPALIIDLRVNGGGFAGLAYGLSEYLYDEEVTLWGGSSYNDLLGEFEEPEFFVELEPRPFTYDGPVAVLVSPYCISACEGFAYSLTSTGRAIAVGHAATAGAFGAVGGQYKLPGDYDMQFPTTRSVTPDGEIILEDVGVVPDLLVPITLDDVLSGRDAVLEAAIEALQ